MRLSASLEFGVAGEDSAAQDLTAAESAEYEARALAELGPECARWLATGEGM